MSINDYDVFSLLIPKCIFVYKKIINGVHAFMLNFF